MIDKIQLTLYEIFGYLLPGAIGTAAVAIFYWGTCLPHTTFPIYKVHPDALGWAVLTGISYLFGHLAQGIGTKYLKGAEKAALENSELVPPAIVSSAKERAATIVGVQPADIDSVSLFRLADEYTLQKGVSGDREVFIYREGFYKGSTIALALLCIALLIRSFGGTTAVGFPSYTYYVSRIQVLTTALIAAAASRLCRQRFRRFGIYRVSRAIFAFLALSQESPSSPAVSKGAKDA